MDSKTTILYLGNKLQKHGKTPTSIDTLSAQLSENFHVITASEKMNVVARFFDMIFTLIKSRKQIDYLLIDTYSTLNFYYVFLISLLARWYKIKYYPYLHGGNLPQRLKKNRFISEMIFMNSEINIAPSEYLQESFLKYGYKTIFIPNNIEIELYTFQQRSKVAPTFLYVRAFSEIYNPQLAIRSFSAIKKKYKNAKFLMVGPDKDGTLGKMKRLVKDLDLENSVTFTGKLSKIEWFERSKEYDIFLNPTLFDNQPVSVIEAMALGMVVVSTNVGGLPFLVSHKKDGYLVNPTESDMIKCIHMILDSSTRDISYNARVKAETYAWSNISLKWKQLFEKKRDEI